MDVLEKGGPLAAAAWLATGAAALWACGWALSFPAWPIEAGHASDLWDQVQELSAEGRPSDALSDVRRLLRSFPENPQYLQREAQLLQDLRSWGSAARVWKVFVGVSPAAVEACPDWPQDYEKLGLPDEALVAYKSCLDLDPTKPDLIFYYGLGLERAGRASEARSLYEQVLAVTPGNADAAIGLARLSLNAGDAAGAFARLQALPPAARDTSDALMITGEALDQLGRRPEGIALLRQAARQSPTYADVFRVLARLESKDGQVEAAARDREKAESLDAAQ